MPAPSGWPSYRDTSRNGEANLEVSQTYASDGLVVLAMMLRQRSEVGGLPAQDWSLRVTEVYRKNGSEWQPVHRHADPLVQRITLQQAAVLARGRYLLFCMFSAATCAAEMPSSASP